ncbi:carbohydrate kinase family protein [Microbacterium caowuchunii]|uniref:Carbohydrate kinase n=1 Tax=Microbacterium caowuchunii TaxID=2614638 RepID=A0A5N0TGW2_9MICO|nr:carbohydrate kinase [Microbacterium caowuchunii]KAA9134403.1 carbohydrate kinase [Microbacterium caowuchunii]
MTRIAVVGESLVDAVRLADGAERETPGGAPFNVAIGIARLGGTVRLLTAIGDDARGRLLTQRLKADGVHASFHQLPRTSVARAEIETNGSASYNFDIDGSFDLTPSMRAALAVADAVHVGSIAAHLPPGAQRITEVFRDLQGTALLSYDPNCRPSITPNVKTVRAEVETFASIADVVKASDEDMTWLYPDIPYTEVAAMWLRLGAGLVVVTRGAAGIWCRNGSGREASIPTLPTTVVDTIGAGDSCMAALIVCLTQLGASGSKASARLSALTSRELKDILRTAAQVASITCSREGANPPTAAELERISPTATTLSNP